MKKIVGIGCVLSAALMMGGMVYGHHLDSYGIVLDHGEYTHLPTPIRNLQYSETAEDRHILMKLQEFLKEKSCVELSQFEQKLSKKVIDLELAGVYDGRMVLIEHEGELMGVLGAYMFPIQATEMDLPDIGYRKQKIDQSSEDHYVDDEYYSNPSLFYYNIFDNQIEYVLYEAYDLIMAIGFERYNELYPNITSTELNQMSMTGFDDQELEACFGMSLPRTGLMKAKLYELSEEVE